MENLVEELKKLHLAHKTDRYSKMGIAIALGVDRRTVRRWFQGQSLPSEKHLKMIKKLITDLEKPAPEI